MADAPAAAAVAGADGAGRAPGQQQRPGGGILSTILRMALFWYMMNYFKGGNQKPAEKPENFFAPLYQKGRAMDMYAYITESPSPMSIKQSYPIWVEKDLRLASSGERTLNYTYHPSAAVQNNGSVYLHLGFKLADEDLDQEQEAVDAVPTYFDFTKSYRLNHYMAKPKNKTGVSLLKSDSEQLRQLKEQLQNETERVFLNYWKPNCSVVMVDHFTTHARNAVPPQISNLLDIDEEGHHYYPIIAINDFWLLKDKYLPLNSSVDEYNVTFSINSQNFWWFGIQQQMEQSFQMQSSLGMANEGESDEVKRIFIEGNPYFLGLTMFVSMLHTVFDMLAFKNDIGFWKNNKSMEGLSARSVLINAGCQLVILLYLFDNETSFVVLLSSVLGTAIEFWKVTKAMDVTFDRTKFPFLRIKDRATYSKNKTKQYDEEATRYLSYVLYPLVIGYAIYTLMYQTHKSWYSWIVSSLVGAVYMFGFILMCPQLYLNYKLKSVAHLPWRQMTYKFLNTIIDDLFAFVIKMPTLHRLSVFRDDLVFLVYLYQRWIYRVDKTRVNEFGYTEATPEEIEGEKEGGEGEAVAALPGTSGGDGEGEKGEEELPELEDLTAGGEKGGEEEEEEVEAEVVKGGRKRASRRKA